MGFEQFKVQELRAALVVAGLSETEADAIKGKTALVEAVTKRADELGLDPVEFVTVGTDNVEVDEVDFSQVEMESDGDVFDGVAEETEPAPAKVPMYNSPEWSDYVMTKFAEGEIYDGNPTVPGLRRVAEEVLGPIIVSGPVSLNAQHPENPEFVGRASCVYEVTFEWLRDLSRFTSEEDIVNGKLPRRTFRAAAGSNQNNTDAEFAIYPEAMAETRAEARALRKALGLKNVVANEELTKQDAHEAVKRSVIRNQQPVSFFDEVSGEGGDKIKTNQKVHIEAKCKQLGIDVLKFINVGERDYDSIEDVSQDTAAKMIAELTRYQSETGGKESRNIPEEILLEN